MHAGKIGGLSAAAVLYRFLANNVGEWMDAWELSRMCGTTCISTRVSEVRKQLPPGLVIEHEERRIDCLRRQFYRLRRTE